MTAPKRALEPVAESRAYPATLADGQPQLQQRDRMPLAAMTTTN